MRLEISSNVERTDRNVWSTRGRLQMTKVIARSMEIDRVVPVRKVIGAEMEQMSCGICGTILDQADLIIQEDASPTLSFHFIPRE